MCDKGTNTLNSIKEFKGIMCNDCLIIVFNSLSEKSHGKRNKKPLTL